jgi:carnitine O-acetyltransferase
VSLLPPSLHPPYSLQHILTDPVIKSCRTDTSPQTRTAIWLRDSTRKIFGTCRVPGAGGCDSLSSYSSPAVNGGISGVEGKLMVMVHDWCYVVDCYHPLNTSSGPSTTSSINYPAPSSANSSSTFASANPGPADLATRPSPEREREHEPEAQPSPKRIPPAELERRLRCVARDAAQRLAGGEKAVPIGVLSSDGRDRWAEVCSFSSSIDLQIE